MANQLNNYTATREHPVKIWADTLLFLSCFLVNITGTGFFTVSLQGPLFLRGGVAGRGARPSRLVQPTTDGVCGGGMQCTRGTVSEGEYVVEVSSVPEGLCQMVSMWWRRALYRRGCARYLITQ